MITLGRHFSRAQTADLIKRALAVSQEDAWSAGFLAGQAEATERHLDALAVAYATPPWREVDTRRDIERRTARREADTAAGHPWRGDHPGGAVPAW